MTVVLSRKFFLASAATVALAIAAPAEAQVAEVAVGATVPSPAPEPRGFLGGLFKRKQRPVEVVVESPAPVIAIETVQTDGDPAPIDLVPPDAGTPAPAEEATVPNRPTFVLAKVPDAEVPLPRSNPRRAAAAVDIVVAVAETAESEPEPAAAREVDAPSFEPDIPPPAMAAPVPEPAHGEPPAMDDGQNAGEPMLAVAETVSVVEPEAPAEPPAPAVVAASGPAPLLEMEAEPAPPSKPHDAAAAHETDEDLLLFSGSEAPAHAEHDPLPGGAIEPATPEMPPLAGGEVDAAAEPDERMAAEVLVAGARNAESPREIVEFLIRAQDAVAAGSVPALAAQRRIRAEIDRNFADADPAVWQEPTNTVAAATYVLSGGSPDILRRFAELDPKPAGDERLWRGALAYVEGRQGEAAGMLLDLDIGDLPSRIGGQVALAQAALIVGTDPRRALDRLDMARLVAPGTLVEEAAIRRSLLVAEQLKDQDRFEMLVRQYLARFRHSIYAGNFRYRFAAALSRSPILDDPAQFPRLDALLEQLGPDARRSHYLTVASAAVVSGKMAAVTFAAERALALAGPESPDQSRARLYRSAALFLEAETFEAAETDFAKINVAMLDPADRALHEAINELATSIRSGVDPEILALVPASGPMPGDETSEGDDPLVARAKALSGEVDLLLADAS